jgi:hypothetical protein
MRLNEKIMDAMAGLSRPDSEARHPERRTFVDDFPPFSGETGVCLAGAGVPPVRPHVIIRSKVVD